MRDLVANVNGRGKLKSRIPAVISCCVVDVDIRQGNGDVKQKKKGERSEEKKPYLADPEEFLGADRLEMPSSTIGER